MAEKICSQIVACSLDMDPSCVDPAVDLRSTTQTNISFLSCRSPKKCVKVKAKMKMTRFVELNAKGCKQPTISRTQRPTHRPTLTLDRENNAPWKVRAHPSQRREPRRRVLCCVRCRVEHAGKT